ncbi:hypothetical protein P1X14_08795 [Sphingomonas sp. AOB5]|uniref:hypothetical protein n=1 Tax=Sphingomonas sp. AOB5 TaxID=3034017 RepID=UPI0023F78BB3|nr:hypothetical protein [Sphingomonas sp. AOB5]MDF7775342.1 hypothetical protein [Sphingomonas sp. AOB5]
MKHIVRYLAGLIAAFAIAGTAQAQDKIHAYALAVSETSSLGGVIHYTIGADGTLDGRFTYHAGGGRIDSEVATPRKRSRNATGVYDTRGTVNGVAYTGTLTVTRLGAGAGGTDILEFVWNNGDRGIGVRHPLGLIVAYGGDEAGLLSELEPGRWTLAVMGWNGETGRLIGYEWRATQPAGSYAGKPMFGGDAGGIVIEQVGDAYRLKLPGGAVGVAIDAVR